MNQEKQINHQLLRKVLQGDRIAIKEFVDLCNQWIWGALKRFDQLSYEDKEDVQSQIMHKEIFGKSGDWKGIKKFRAQSKFTTYLYGIVTFRALDFLKSKGMKYSAKSVSVDSQINISNTEIDPNDQMTIDSTLSILTDKEKKIINLYSEGYKHREIAIKLGTSTNNISSIISRAQKKMQKYNAIKQTNSQS